LAGPVICRAIVAVTGADMVLVNQGAVRGGLTAGAVTVGDLMDCLPFPDRIVEIPMAGEDLRRLCERLLAGGGFPYRAGLGPMVGGGSGGRSSLAGLADAAGRRADLSRTYRLAISGQAMRRAGIEPSEGYRELGRVVELAAAGLALLNVGDKTPAAGLRAHEAGRPEEEEDE
jgi:2',3'-cyclic-nucleotide 2'-phosphodiesterase (5'-nucleotidase family)